MTSRTERDIQLGDVEPLLVLGGSDSNLRAIQERYAVRIVLRDRALNVSGEPEPVRQAAAILDGLLRQARTGRAADLTDVQVAASEVLTGDDGGGPVEVGGALIRPRSIGQARYLAAIRAHDIVFGIGPAGTGKTFLAVALAVAALTDQQVERILLVRPAVEAGESLGFLPGDYREKVDPYLRPLYDALGEMMLHDRVRKLIEVGVIEIAPLAYMRGRTLNRAFVILDEGQNTTVGQMKMFLTRLGPQSQAVITGDITQVDLEDPSQSGLIQMQHVLAGIEQIGFVYLDERDVVRHRLVRDIIRAFEQHGAEGRQGADHDSDKTRST